DVYKRQGDGLAIAYDAGVELCDMEFVQFHPTVLKHPSAPPLLITESIRGEGGILRNIYGERFVPKYHEMGELAPRDVVSRIITEEMERTNSDYVYLDITHLSKEFILSHFPMIYSECLKYGIDITRDYIPVAPGAHYMMGGIRTNLKGETCIKGLYACGECAGTGIHGANRMASNSLLEGLVFGKIIAQEVSEYVLNNGNISTLDMEVTKKEVCKEEILREFRVEMQNLMWKYCGIRRKEEGLRTLLERLEKMQQEVKDMPVNNFKDVETKNMLVLSKLIAESALERRESRGAHFREDYPYRDDIYWQKHIIKKKGRV
ncbi:MAG: FAD-binding protein, partial [bacterium]|nr:FAD-binding protein [bacterium]